LKQLHAMLGEITEILRFMPYRLLVITGIKSIHSIGRAPFICKSRSLVSDTIDAEKKGNFFELRN
jgi:hypothetical protein